MSVAPNWRLSELGEVCSFENGDRGVNYPSPGSFVSEGVPFVNAGHLQGGIVRFRPMDYITDEAFARLGAGKYSSGDILFCLRGSLGKFGVIRDGDRPGAIASSLVIVRPKKGRVSTQYLAAYFGSELCSLEIEKWAGGAAQPNLGARDLARFAIPLPPAPEQELVGSAIKSADAQVESIERLIAKKRDIKEGLMQELLSGRTRLPGFAGKWEDSRLGDVVSVDPESLTPATTPPNEAIDYISLEEVSRGRILGSTSYRFANAPSRARRRLRTDDVLFGTVRPNLQSHARYAGRLPFPVASTGFAVIRTRTGITEASFLAQWVLSTDVMVQIDRIIAGSNYPAVSSRDVRSLGLSLPSVEEQVAIGTVLQDADDEIAALERRLESARAVMQGMMQELLTGRTRLTEEMVA